MGVVGGVSVVLSVVIIVAYRNYRYEQELDLLLWKVEPKELKAKEWKMCTKNGKNVINATD